MIKRAFKAHPESVGETYFEHMGSAFFFSSKMLVAGFACMMHGLFPFMFKCSGRNAINELHDRMVVHRHKNSCAENDLSAFEQPAE